MKNIALLICCFITAILSAQKPEPIIKRAAFWVDYYEYKGERVKPPCIQLHLDKYNTVAGQVYRSGRADEPGAIICAIVGIAGTVAGITGTNSQNKIVGYSTALLGFTGAVFLSITGNHKQDNAIKFYNDKL